jgi:hypothetical protein
MIQEASLTNIHVTKEKREVYSEVYEVPEVGIQDDRRRLQGTKIRYSVSRLPPRTPVQFINLQEKELGPQDDWIYAIFKCKGDCKTIFTEENIKEMNRFTQLMTEDRLWHMFCVREKNQRIVDGRGCSSNAYNNVTRYIEDAIQPGSSQEDVDAIVKQYAPLLLSNPQARRMLDKDFSEENPNSKYMALVFQTTDNVFVSNIMNEGGFYKEFRAKVFEGDALLNQRMKLGKRMYEISNNF